MSWIFSRKEMTAVVVTLTAVAVGIYSAKTGTGIMGRYVEVQAVVVGLCFLFCFRSTS